MYFVIIKFNILIYLVIGHLPVLTNTTAFIIL